MRTALVHDWLTGMRGGEKVLDQLCVLRPDADLYTLLHVPGSTNERIEQRRIVTSPLQRFPDVASNYRKLLPLFPWAISRLEIAAGTGLVISSSHAVAKSVRPPAGATHLSYCFTPMRYVWDQIDAYLGTGLRRRLSAPLVAYLRSFDRRTSGPDRVHRFVAISHHVADRIRRNYGREASVVYPPVDVGRFAPSGARAEPFYFLLGGFVPYKRESLAIEAFRGLDRELWIAGDGPGRAELEEHAPANVRFLGRVDDATLADLYARCRALVYPQEEDFGIIPVECQAAGRPVIAYGGGGATETVVPLGDPAGRAPTGVWFDRHEPRALRDALERFEAAAERFDPDAIRLHAEGFRNERFRSEIESEIEQALAAGPRGGAAQ